MACYADLGKFPESGPVSREKALFYKLTDENSIKLISGDKTPALISLWCSNDVVQFGTIKLLTGGRGPQQTEVDSHPGDAVFKVKTGPMSFFFPERGQTFTCEAGEVMYIPENEKYKIINYSGTVVEAIFAIAPKL